jgi:hypothetical protein
VTHSGEICCEDPDGIRWRQVSILERVGTNMPSTSDTIECMNGHLNEDTLRHNTFWVSQHRWTEAMAQKIGNFTHCVIHNTEYEFRKVGRRAAAVSEEQMTAELEYLRRSICGCSALAFPFIT